MINYQTNDIELEKFMDVKALRDRIQELHDSGDCGHMLSDILHMANKICSNSSEANFAWLAGALERYARGDVITVPAGTGTERSSSRGLRIKVVMAVPQSKFQPANQNE